MFIKEIKKKNKNSDKVYIYYRLVHTYKVGKKSRHQNVLNLGKLKGLPKESHKMLANRIEEILTGTVSLFLDIPEDIERSAQGFSQEIVRKEVFPVKKKKRFVSQEPTEDYQEVDLNSIEQSESKSIGGEWLVKQTFDIFGLKDLLLDTGMDSKQADVAQMLLTARLLHPSSELEAERWLRDNSGASELYGPGDLHPASRHRLYKAAGHMYKNKDIIEKHLYSKSYNLFSERSKVVIYDLTNMYFEGRMRKSEKAKFGHSKEKRYDCRLVSLALAIDSLGFVRHSQIYPGNVTEHKTLVQLLDNIAKQLGSDGEKPLVIIDAGIATEGSLEILKQRNHDYICVGRGKPKEYTRLTEKATRLSDNRGHAIEVAKVSVKGKSGTFLHIKSHQKAIKEESMGEKLTQRFEERMEYLREGLPLPRRTKKIVAVHETVGRIKDQFSKVAKNYKITYLEDKKKGVVTDIKWEKQKARQRPKGEYFLRYSKEKLNEKEIWDGYNLSRDVEACFRCLKTDLNIRPVHHQKDTWIEPHIWLGVVAYTFVNYIRIKLKENGINHSWTTIVEKLQGLQCSLQSMDKRDSAKIYTKLCTRPNPELQKIYKALGFKDRPFVRKTKVVPQL